MYMRYLLIPLLWLAALQSSYAQIMEPGDWSVGLSATGTQNVNSELSFAQFDLKHLRLSGSRRLSHLWGLDLSYTRGKSALSEGSTGYRSGSIWMQAVELNAQLYFLDRGRFSLYLLGGLGVVTLPTMENWGPMLNAGGGGDLWITPHVGLTGSVIAHGGTGDGAKYLQYSAGLRFRIPGGPKYKYTHPAYVKFYNHSTSLGKLGAGKRAKIIKRKTVKPQPK